MQNKNVTWREWITALRSGGYSQGMGSLRLTRSAGNGEGFSVYCCQGVVCDLMNDEAWGTLDKWFYLPGCFSRTTFPFQVDRAINKVFPKPFAHARTWLGESVRDVNFTTHLISMNDGGNWDFRGIAAFIESMCNIYGVKLDSVIYDWSNE